MATKNKKDAGDAYVVRFLSFHYFVAKKDAMGNQIMSRRDAYKGDVITGLSEEDILRGIELGALVEADSPEAELVQKGQEFSAMSVEELADWMLEQQPTIPEVLEAIGDDKDLAARMLEAENFATGNDPRAGLAEAVAKIVGQG